MSRLILVIGLLGGSLFLLSGALEILPWGISGPLGGVLLGSWFGGEIKKRLEKAGEKGKETRVIRFRQKSDLETNVSELRSKGWEPKWESYRETHTGLVIRRIVYSVVMERTQRKTERKGFGQLSRLIFWRK